MSILANERQNRERAVKNILTARSNKKQQNVKSIEESHFGGKL